MYVVPFTRSFQFDGSAVRYFVFEKLFLAFLRVRVSGGEAPLLLPAFHTVPVVSIPGEVLVKLCRITLEGNLQKEEGRRKDVYNYISMGCRINL